MAPAASAPSVKNRARSVAHRWGPAAVVSAAGPQLIALGIRFDEEDLPTSETFVMRLGPGKADAVDGMVGTAQAVAVTPAGAVFVLDARGTLSVAGKRHQLPGGCALAADVDGVWVAGDTRLHRFSAAGEPLGDVHNASALLLSSSPVGLLCATANHRLALLKSGALADVPQPASAHGPSAIHLDVDGTITAAFGTAIIQGTSAGVVVMATSTFHIDAIARFKGRTFAASKVHGLCVVSEGAVHKLRPSIRAHTLTANDDVMVASAALCLATTDDGVEFLTRDLAPFVRIADQRVPRFLPSASIDV